SPSRAPTPPARRLRSAPISLWRPFRNPSWIGISPSSGRMTGFPRWGTTISQCSLRPNPHPRFWRLRIISARHSLLSMRTGFSKRQYDLAGSDASAPAALAPPAAATFRVLRTASRRQRYLLGQPGERIDPVGQGHGVDEMALKSGFQRGLDLFDTAHR